MTTLTAAISMSAKCDPHMGIKDRTRPAPRTAASPQRIRFTTRKHANHAAVDTIEYKHVAAANVPRKAAKPALFFRVSLASDGGFATARPSCIAGDASSRNAAVQHQPTKTPRSAPSAVRLEQLGA